MKKLIKLYFHTEKEIINLPELDDTEHYYGTESQTVEMKSAESKN